MLPLEAMGVSFRIEDDIGPLVANSIRNEADVDSLRAIDPEGDLGFVYSAIDRTIQKLDGLVPLIGFSGAPFTLAAYMIEGGPSRTLEKTKVFMYSQPGAWEALMGKLTEMAIAYLGAQVRHGVSAIQLFDSWVGALSPFDYETFVLPYTRKINSSLATVPKIHFCADSSALLELFQRTGPDVLSVDWRVPVSSVWERCGDAIAVQGNLDPILALTGGREMIRQASHILTQAADRRGYIFSLGHGVLKETPPKHLVQLVQMVHAFTAARA
jgi:uroporphyrinogen decarboxylase